MIYSPTGNPFWPRHAHLFKLGGGGGGSSKSQPVVAATPPVTASAAEVIQAGQQQRRDAAKRKGLQRTLLAGETGGYMAPGGNQPKSLLGQ
jgi:hypothetical protein